MHAAPSRRYFPGVNALRGFAAMLVVVQHGAFFGAQANGTQFDAILKIPAGSLGVNMFFVISGFVIGLNRHLPTGEFVARRALRIYPGFWAAYALSAALMLQIGIPTGFSWYSPFLLPSANYTLIHVPVWTLVFEVCFYALAAATFSLRLSDRALTGVILCWMIAIMNMTPYMTAKLAVSPGALTPVAQNNLFFAAGLLCALHLEFLSKFSMNYFLAAAVLATAANSTFSGNMSVLVLAVALSGLLLAATKLDRVPRAAMLLGDASYGLFLMHYSAMAVASEGLRGADLSVWALWVILIGVGLLVGLPFGTIEFRLHRAILRKLMNYLHRPAIGTRPALSPAPSDTG